MIILTIRTDKPEAEIGLFTANTKLSYITWEAHRQLAETLHKTIRTVLDGQHMTWQNIEAIVVFKGPGSFTGLRIGMTVANTLAASLKVPIVSRIGEDWIQQGITAVIAGQNEVTAMPEYGALPNITQPRK